MVSIAAFAEVAALVGDPARANMLATLIDGRALTAAELARVASITPQTASGHLARMTAAGLLSMERQGRHRYHRLASGQVAAMLEGIMAVAGAGVAGGGVVRPVRTGPRDAQMRAARTCYGHLAGRLAVGIADVLVARGHIELSEDGGVVTAEGDAFFRRLGVGMETRRGRIFCRPCLDWSERRPHLAGAVGTALCTHCLDRGWVRRIDGTRALLVTPEGRRQLRDSFGVE